MCDIFFKTSKAPSSPVFDMHTSNICADIHNSGYRILDNYQIDVLPEIETELVFENHENKTEN